MDSAGEPIRFGTLDRYVICRAEKACPRCGHIMVLRIDRETLMAMAAEASTMDAACPSCRQALQLEVTT